MPPFPKKAQLQPSTAPPVWKHWQDNHPEFQREYQTEINYNDDKILILGGYVVNRTQKALNLILVDPENQTFKVISSIGDDAESCCWADMSACYWEDSKVVVFGGSKKDERVYCSTVAIITLKALETENPSAHWEKIVTPTELVRASSSTHIYKDKMYVFGGCNTDMKSNEIWCLDLNEFTWDQCSFKDGSSQIEEAGGEYIFHENKVYAVERGRSYGDRETWKEFDLENMSYKSYAFQRSQTENDLMLVPFPQVINDKAYFLEINTRVRNSQRKVLAFDLGSQSWAEVKTESPPTLTERGHVLCWNNHLIFYPNNDDGFSVFGEFWSLQIGSPKPSKKPSTPTTLNKVQQTMKEFLLEAPYSDISFKVESQTILAHKWILIQKNQFFVNLLSSNNFDKGQDNPSKIPITDLKASTFRALLEYLYCDYVEIDDKIALELLQRAEKYSIPSELKAECERYLTQSIELGNYVALGKLAESIGATSLRDTVVGFIAKNMKKIKTRKDFKEISDALLRDSIVKFIVK